MDTPPIVHKGYKHDPIWLVDADESVFGLTKIHAVLKCKVCNVRRHLPEILGYENFDIKGEVRREYRLKAEKGGTV